MLERENLLPSSGRGRFFCTIGIDYAIGKAQHFLEKELSLREVAFHEPEPIETNGGSANVPKPLTCILRPFGMIIARGCRDPLAFGIPSPLIR